MTIQDFLAVAPIVKYGFLFILVAVEGPLATMLAGFMGFLGYINLFLAYGIIVCADLTSDSIYYAIGFWGREKFVKKYSGQEKISWTKLQKIESALHRHAGKVLITGKLTHMAGVPILIGAGLAKIRFLKFIAYQFIATIPKSLAFLFIGYYFGEATGAINNYLEYGTIITGIIVIIAIIGYFVAGRYFEKKIA